MGGKERNIREDYRSTTINWQSLLQVESNTHALIHPSC